MRPGGRCARTRRGTGRRLLRAGPRGVRRIGPTGVPLDEIAARARGSGPAPSTGIFPAKEALFEAGGHGRGSPIWSATRGGAGRCRRPPARAFLRLPHQDRRGRAAAQARSARCHLDRRLAARGSVSPRLDLLLPSAPSRQGAVPRRDRDARPHRAAEGHVRQPGRQRRPGPARAGVRRAGRRGCAPRRAADLRYASAELVRLCAGAP